MASYDVHFSGSNDPIRIDKGVDALMERWEMYRNKKIPDETARIAGWVGMLSTIRFFRPVEQARSSTGNGGKDANDEYLHNMHAARALAPQARAKRLGFFRLLYWGFTKKKCDGTDVENKAMEIQERFFVENPKRTLCDPSRFHDILPNVEADRSVISIVEEHIRQDRFAARFL